MITFHSRLNKSSQLFNFRNEIFILFSDTILRIITKLIFRERNAITTKRLDDCLVDSVNNWIQMNKVLPGVAKFVEGEIQ